MRAARDASPLRYPGGKAKLTEFLKEVMRFNDISECDYAEPYAGGCGLGLNLLLSGYISNLHINDFDRSVWAFWHAVLEETDELCSLVDSAKVDVENWLIQRDLQTAKDSLEPLTLGFSTFFLNRTNRSGIIHSGGCIGGLQQNGEYKIDCRFNKDDLIRRIRRIAKYKNRIKLTFRDAEEFLSGKTFDQKTIVYIDPPYFEKGQMLYKNAYCSSDHSRLSKLFLSLQNPYLITYDDTAGIRSLYQHREFRSVELQYSAQTKRMGKELLIWGNLTLP